MNTTNERETCMGRSTEAEIDSTIEWWAFCSGIARWEALKSGHKAQTLGAIVPSVARLPEASNAQ